MSARQRRQRKREAREKALQGELLPDVDVSAAPEMPVAGETPRDPVAAPPEAPAGREDAAEARPPAPARPSPGVDRWAKAVGRARAGADTGAGRPPEGVVGMPAASPNGASASERTAEERDPHESARDHAATVPPAGEPLARAKELVERGRVQEAIELYLGILTVNPSNLKAHNNLGVLLDELKQFDAALEHLEAAERLAPENVEVLTNLASTLTSVARYEESEALLKRAQRLGADDPRVRLAIGILYFRRGLYGSAELELAWVCERDRDNGTAFYYRGEALNRLHRFDESEAVLERAVELLPDDPKPYYTLGHLYDRKHLPAEAAEMYRRARRLQGR